MKTPPTYVPPPPTLEGERQMGEVKPPDREARGGSPLASEVGHGETEVEGDPASIECQEESDTFGGKDSSHNNMDGVVDCNGSDMGQRGGTTVVMQNDVVTRCGEMSGSSSNTLDNDSHIRGEQSAHLDSEP